MNRLAVIVACAVTASGCSGSSESAPVPAAESSTQPDAAAPIIRTDGSEVTLGTMEMDNFEMRFYDTLTTVEGGQSPSFYLQADSANSNGETGMRLTRPNATIYGEDEQNVLLKADTGLINEKTETATLTEGVTVDLAEMNLTLETIHYDNIKGHAHSESPVHLDGRSITLDAQSMSIVPKSGVIELSGVTGKINLGGLEP